MGKIDFKKDFKHLYKPSVNDVSFVDVPDMDFLMIDGKGDPNCSPAFQAATEALFALSYALKFMIKKGHTQIDYGVLPLEGLWWGEDMAKFSVENKHDWLWTLMIMQPDFITGDLFSEASQQCQKKKKLPALPQVRLEKFSEGKAAQILHVGPFSEEGPTIEKVHTFIKDNGKTIAGKHHEIYLSDIRKAAPEKWQTIIRQPVK